ncbi:hypothetical protein J1G44_05990 [Cellulomonas sp. zg-ZUI199]|uniref:Uncharacterized protein n=1 Tax=Cellulomonas wangleii TaxID=2816956 RepID=A0ABX8D7M0_9CELL|nr:hypothetical protein [Cellulomonas wangleii]MBO0923747.1 hypothetical protein [Cellulomonas wangleii]MBO0924029.1 hypothetical protein [Cellulomonas wangleii]QVI62057.1 hypothetical protein KG103_16840 [Cellulomonas wangleii]
MSVPDDTTTDTPTDTPIPDGVPDPVVATVPQAESADDRVADGSGLPVIEETVLPKDGSRNPGLPGYA